MYSVLAHGDMVADAARTDAYVEALRRAVKPGDVVLDIGTGTGIFAVLACRFGARRVYAIESADIIEVARQIAAANGCADRIEFVQGLSTRISLPERADVIIADLHGRTPFYDVHLESLADASKRFLAPGGTLIPLADTLWIAPIDAPDLLRRNVRPWTENSYAVDMQAGATLAANSPRSASAKPEAMLAPAACWTELRFGMAAPTGATAQVAFEVRREGQCHGFLTWFDTEVATNLFIRNGPESPRRSYSYSNVFFPLPEAVAVRAGDLISVTVKVNRVGEDYLWSWATRVTRLAAPLAEFKQSEFFAEPLALDKLQRLQATHVPGLGIEGRIDQAVLGWMAARLPLGDIADRLLADFPDRFAQRHEALTRAGELSTRYGE